MVDPIDDDEEEAERRAKKKKGDTGEGDSDSWGRGKAGAGASGAIRLPPQKLKEVMGDWRHLDVKALIEVVAEFFSEVPMRASANLSVAWEKTKSFAIVNWIVDFGARAAVDLSKKQDLGQAGGSGRSGRGAKGLRRQTPKGRSVSPNLGPSGPMGPSGPGGQ